MALNCYVDSFLELILKWKDMHPHSYVLGIMKLSTELRITFRHNDVYIPYNNIGDIV